MRKVFKNKKTYEVELLIEWSRIGSSPEVIDPSWETTLLEHVVKGHIQHQVIIHKGLEPVWSPVQCKVMEILSKILAVWKRVFCMGHLESVELV